jgi:thiamine biosynthesis lipoprotein
VSTAVPVGAPTFTKFTAFGSEAVLGVTEPEQLGAARDAVDRVVADFDLACSRFREDSELIAVNAAAGGPPVAVSALLRDAVQAALRAARLTEGDVDPTVGEALIALGYDRDFDADGFGSTVRFAAVPGWQAVHIDPAAGTIGLEPGVSLDLGATAKALAADRAARSAFDAAGCGTLVGFGGDLAFAGPAPAGGWPVRVTDDHRAGTQAPGQSITLESGGLATSSTTVRRWGSVHHVVDPATGGPAAVVWRTVSAAAASCLDANIATTAAIVRGQRAVPWLSSLGLPSRLVSAAGRAVHIAGWPSAYEELPV